METLWPPGIGKETALKQAFPTPHRRRQHRPPLSLRISVTDRCQLRCVYCMPPTGVPKAHHDDILTFEEIVRFVRALRSRFRLDKVRITGGEPLIRPGIVDLVAMLAAEGIDDLALTTNGQQLAEMAGDLKRAGLRRVNISLDSLDEGSFAALTRGGRLHSTLNGIEAAVRAGLTPVKLNTVVLRDYNDTVVADIARFGLAAGCQVRFLELMPIGCAADAPDLFVPVDEVRSRLEPHFSLEPLAHERSSSSRNFRASDAYGRRGTIGFIPSRTEPFCEGCRRIRLTSTGRIVSCLALGEGPNVQALLGRSDPAAGRELADIVATELAGKCARTAFRTHRPMAAVGG